MLIVCLIVCLFVVVIGGCGVWLCVVGVGWLFGRFGFMLWLLLWLLVCFVVVVVVVVNVVVVVVVDCC